MNCKFFGFLMLFFLLAGTASAGTFRQYAVKEGVGIRPLAMGGAFTAVADDLYAISYNPAGLADQVFGLSLCNYNLNLGSAYNGSSGYLNLGSFGYGWRGYLAPNADSASVGTLAYGRRGGNGFNWGLSYKSVDSNLSGSASHSWSSDAGLLVRVTPWLNLGFLAEDFIGGRDLIVGGSSRIGFALIAPRREMILAADFENDSSRPGENISHCGFEFSVLQGLKLRLGFNQGYPTGGLGFALPGFAIDYAFASDNGSSTLRQAVGATVQIPSLKERTFSVVKPKEFVQIDVQGDLVGGQDQLSIFGGRRSGVDSLLLQIRRAGRDPAVEGILLRLAGFDGGLGGVAMAQELRTELKRAQQRGKKVVAYIEESAWGEEYYLAAVADKIVVPPGASLGGIGEAVVIPRVADLCDKIGIEWEMWSTGKYKDAFYPFKKGLSKEQRQMLEEVVSDIYRQVVTDIGLDRKIKLETVKEIGDGRLLTVEEARKIGLIDETGYLNDAVKTGGRLCNSEQEVKLISVDLLEPDPFEDYLFTVFNRVAVINIEGEIVSGKSGANLLFGGIATGADTVTSQIKKAAEDPQVKALILRINSGGGSSVASGQIYEEIKKARDKGKVVVASLGDIAASGGYFVAAGAQKIVADPATITGGIGVIGYFPVLEKLYEKLGVKMEVVKEGKHADMFSGTRRLSKDERESLEKLMYESYEEFLAAVVEGRGLTTAEARARGGGKLYTGSRAKDEKLVDRLGGFSDAIDLAKEQAKISGEVDLIFYDEERGFWNQMGFKAKTLLNLW